MSGFETLSLNQNDSYIEITIDRPAVLNALSQQVLIDLETALNQFAAPSDARALVLSGSGEKAFVAGADISEMKQMDAQAAKAFAERGQRITRILEQLPLITIAKVKGFALGGGCELAMACDLIIAASNAKFGQPEVNLGLIPGFGGTQRLVRRVGLPTALDMLCAGRTLSAEEAFTLGLVSRVCAPEELNNEVAKTIKKICKSGPRANALTKRLTRSAYHMSLEAGLEAEGSAFATCFAGSEALEGMSAFIEKRSASFAR